MLRYFTLNGRGHQSCLVSSLISCVWFWVCRELFNCIARVSVSSMAARSQNFLGSIICTSPYFDLVGLWFSWNCCALPSRLVKGNASLLAWDKPVPNLVILLSKSILWMLRYIKLKGRGHHLVGISTFCSWYLGSRYRCSDPIDCHSRLSDLEGPWRPSVSNMKKSSIPIDRLCVSSFVSCWTKGLLLCRSSLGISFSISVAGILLAGVETLLFGLRRLYFSLKYEFMVIMTAILTGIIFTALLSLALPSSSLGERSFSPFSSVSDRFIPPSPYSLLEQIVLSSVVLAKFVALRAFVDHLVALGLKKVVSPTSDKDFISGILSLDIWILIFPLKLKDVAICCISLASISLLSCLCLKIVVVLYFLSPIIWIWFPPMWSVCKFNI